MINRLRKAWLVWCMWRTIAHDKELDACYAHEKQRNADAIRRYSEIIENFDLNIRRQAIGNTPL